MGVVSFPSLGETVFSEAEFFAPDGKPQIS
jgi:hypothetical protein